MFEPAPGGQPSDIVFHWSAGWPLRCLECTKDVDVKAAQVGPIEGGLAAPRWIVPSRPQTPFEFMLGGTFLPTRPIAVGFMGDVLVYSIPAMLLISAASAARQVMRSRTGRCPSCNYDRRGLAAESKCPECGAK